MNTQLRCTVTLCMEMYHCHGSPLRNQKFSHQIESPLWLSWGQRVTCWLLLLHFLCPQGVSHLRSGFSKAVELRAQQAVMVAGLLRAEINCPRKYRTMSPAAANTSKVEIKSKFLPQTCFYLNINNVKNQQNDGHFQFLKLNMSVLKCLYFFDFTGPGIKSPHHRKAKSSLEWWPLILSLTQCTVFYIRVWATPNRLLLISLIFLYWWKDWGATSSREA